ncbi:MAG: DUF115 domain-containing protein [Treponema sp.]|nr:DUF115 domain-containing protein [Treponema sp.]
MAKEEPVLIEAFLSDESEGKAFTLQYKNRFLYSKYNPQKNILQTIKGLDILPGTLILAFSPCLFYGFEELKRKCQASSSKILFIEADQGLFEFERRQAKEKDLDAEFLPEERLSPQGLYDYFNESEIKFRRLIRIDFSAGASLNAPLYQNLQEATQNIISAFWKNRLTLVRLGRLYSKNLFKNLLMAASAAPFESLEKTVQKPILLCGAGESLDFLTKAQNAALANDNFFVLAVDAAIPALSEVGIKIDAVAATESQLAIEKAYIGLEGTMKKNGSSPLFFFDLTSRNQLARRFLKNSSFYFSEYDQNKFLGRLKKEGFLPPLFPPLGSIGLTAAYLALRLRKGQNVPVYAIGLDFSFSAGKSHAKGTAQSKALCLSSNRLRPCANYGAAFSLGSQKIVGKNKQEMWTTKNLFGYASLFNQYFLGAKNLFDIGASGIDLGLEKKDALQVLQEESSKKNCFIEKNAAPKTQAADREKFQKSRDFLNSELHELKALADLLSNGEQSFARDKKLSLDEQIMSSLQEKDYLFLHFPDGTAASLERSFLTRVRAQIDFFAKDIELALEKN